MLLISDANIFIDLYKLNLLQLFSELQHSVATTDFVYNELYQEQKELVDKIGVEVFVSSPEELGTFFQEFQSLGQVSISYQDYSVYDAAKKHDGVVLSNDKRLRNFAKTKGVNVFGLFFILDEMHAQGLVESSVMLSKLELLGTINKRLPTSELDKRKEMLQELLS